jgi:uncharacterized protein (DUF2252 family)
MQWVSPEERRNLGQARRKQVGRQEHNELKPKARKTPAPVLLERSMKGRVPQLVKLKYQLMAESPFAYFRGAVPVMAADLAVLPNTGIVCQICGDAHVRNLGAFAAPDGRLVFDINDFDETIRGPFEWDLKRMVASLVLAGRASGHKDSSARQAAEKCIESYAALINTFAGMSMLEVARYQVHRIGSVAPIHAALLKAERATPQHSLNQLTEPDPRAAAPNPASTNKSAESNKSAKQTRSKAESRAKPEAGPDAGSQCTAEVRRFKEAKPMLTRVSAAQAQAVLASLDTYREMLEPQRQHLLSLYRPIDVAFKVVGTGSVGLRDYCVYFEGNAPGSPNRDPLFLQIKEEPASGYAAYLPDARAPHHNGRRVAEGQKAMQVQSDPFLGWTRIGNRDYLVRQLNDHKGSIEIDDLSGDGLQAYAELCGELLARGHARSGDPVTIAGYVGSGDGFAEALAKFGVAYADQTEKDWEVLKKSGKGVAK